MIGGLMLLAFGAGADLSALDRTVRKEPAYAGTPGYLLLVFGPDAGHKVWVVRDGDTLHVDRDADGDLTGPNEAVKAGGAAGGRRWEVGATGPHSNLDVSVDKLSVFGTVVAGHPLAKPLLAAEPDAEVVRLSADVRVPGLTGGGAGGRVDVSAGFYDHGGFLRFAPTPAAAPVVWLGGPLAIDQFGWRAPALRLGRGPEFYTAVGTRGAGPGTFASVAHDTLMPRDAHPLAEVRYPNKQTDGPPVVARYELAKRCCGINLYAPLVPPPDAGPGLATVTLSYPAWAAGKVAPSQFNVLLRPAPATKSEAVSAKLVRTLPHPDRAAAVSHVAVSADGTRVFGAGYPSGILQVWDAATGAEVQTIRTPPGYRGSDRYARLTADWSRVLVPQDNRTVVREEAAGTRAMRAEFAGEVRVYDLLTGKLARTVATPGRGPLAAVPSPDGSRLVTLERPGHPLGGKWAPGDRTVFRDLAAGTAVELLKGYGDAAFSPAGDRLAVASMPLQDDEPKRAAVVLFDAATGATVRTLHDAPGGQAWAPTFSPDGRRLLAGVDTGEKPGGRSLRVWDAATGAEVVRLLPPHPSPVLIPRFTPDGAGVLAQTYGRHTFVWDLAAGAPPVVADAGDGAMTRAAAVSPDRRTQAVAAMPKPDPSLGNTPDPQDMGQPWVDLYDLPAGTRRERLVGPHGYITSVAFAPDGRTLFAGANGGVLVFAVR